MQYLRDLIDHQSLQEIQDKFANATGLAFVTTNYAGKPMTTMSNFTRFCQQVRSSSCKCQQSDAHGGIEAARNGKPHLYLCHCGLIDFAIPIITNGDYLGSVMGGQVRVSPEDMSRISYVVEASSNILNDPELLKLYEEIEVQPLDKIIATADLVYNVINYMMEKTVMKIIQDVPEKGPEDHQSETLEILGKYIEKAQIEKEKTRQLLGEVCQRILDKHFKAAKDALSRLIQHISPLKQDQPHFLTAKEEYHNIGRQMIETAAQVVVISDVVQWEMLNKIGACSEVYALNGWLLETLDKVFDAIMAEDDRHFSDEMVRAQNYIEKNFARQIRLEDVADYVNMSKHYFSKVFKKRMGVNFIDYVTQLKVEKSKELLAHTTRSVEDIAAEIGFNEPNYFARVFKNAVGTTPSRYRESQRKKI